MKKHTTELNVFHNGHIVGYLNLGERNKIVFAYDNSWIKNGFNISPVELSFNTKPQTAADSLFNGLHGVFADSISDGWGLMLTDKALQKKFSWDRETINQLDRLFFMGNRSMGGFDYEPSDIKTNDETKFNLEMIYEETEKIIKNEDHEVIKDLYLSGGSPGGARPKAVFARNGDTFKAGYNKIPEGFDGWLVKFFGEKDSPNIGKIEMAYSDMARSAGILMEPTELIEVNIKNKKYFFFSTKRFDRNKSQKIHIASLSGLLYASHRFPSIGYKDIFNLTKHICENKNNIDRLADIMLFNIFLHNKDDHAKNFSYRYNNDSWELSPSYDMVFSQSLGDQHMTDINGSGQPQLEDVSKVLTSFNINNIETKINKFYNLSEQWKEFGKKYDIPIKEINQIDKSLAKVRQSFDIKKTTNLKKKI